MAALDTNLDCICCMTGKEKITQVGEHLCFDCFMRIELKKWERQVDLLYRHHHDPQSHHQVKD